MYAGFLAGSAQITAASALALSLGIAIQNFPERHHLDAPARRRESKAGPLQAVCFRVWLSQSAQW